MIYYLKLKIYQIWYMKINFSYAMYKLHPSLINQGRKINIEIKVQIL